MGGLPHGENGSGGGRGREDHQPGKSLLLGELTVGDMVQALELATDDESGAVVAVRISSGWVDVEGQLQPVLDLVAAAAAAPATGSSDTTTHQEEL